MLIHRDLVMSCQPISALVNLTRRRWIMQSIFALYCVSKKKDAAVRADGVDLA